MKPYKVVNNYVYVVLEHHYSPGVGKKAVDAKVHGVFTEEKYAEGYVKKYRAQFNAIHNSPGYISILKKPIKGKTRDNEVAPRDWFDAW